MMRSGVALQPVYAPGDFEARVARIEAAGYDEFWLTDSSLHSRYSFAYLALAARVTSRLQLGTGVTNPVTRHAALGAVAAATIDEISGGRAVYGIGAGDRPLLSLGLRPARIGMIEDAVVAARRLWAGETVSWKARGFELDDAHLRFPVRPDIPVYVSASGPKTLQMAGRIADGVVLLAGLHPEGLSWAISQIDRGVEQAGRSTRPKITVFAYGAIDDDEAAAVESARTIAAWFPMTAPLYCEMAGLPKDLVERIRAAYTGGEFQEAATAGRLLPIGFVKRMALSGDAAEARAHWRTVAELGVDCLSVFPIGGTPVTKAATIEAMAEIVAAERGPAAVPPHRPATEPVTGPVTDPGPDGIGPGDGSAGNPPTATPEGQS